MDFEQIVKNFGVEFLDIEKNECGNINDTYIVVDSYRVKYCLQEINTYVFPDVEKLMDNIVKVTEYQRYVIGVMGGNPRRECINLLTAGDKYYYADEDGRYWRMYYFIDDAKTYQLVEDPLHFYNAGVAFGNFQRILAGFPAEQLHETIPNFHNTLTRYNDFLDSVNKGIPGRVKECQELIDFVTARRAYASRIVDKLNKGIIPYKVTHNDTKFNNVLIDNSTGKGICVIDLDTIMPGSALYDFGDAIRFGANSAKEDEADLSKVTIDLHLFEMFTKGYLESLDGTLTQEELDELAFSAILMTYECGTRFLADYLVGDKYFISRYERQNYFRARNQFKLVEEMEKQLSQMQSIVKKYTK